MLKFLSKKPTDSPKVEKKKETKRRSSAGKEGSVASLFSPKNSSPTAVALEQSKNSELLFKSILEDNAVIVHQILSRNRPFEKENLKNQMDKISFSEDFSSSSSEFLMFQVDEDVVAKFLANENSLSLRGDDGDDAAICTNEATYPIKMVESGAAMLFLPELLKSPANEDLEPCFASKLITGRSFAMGELCAAVDHLNVGKLKDLLREKELLWDWQERETGHVFGYSMAELLNFVQMSDGEMKTAINDLPVVELKGRLRYLSHNYRAEFFGYIIEFCDDDEIPGVSMEKVSFEALREKFESSVPDSVLKWFLKRKCRQIQGDDYEIITSELVRETAVITLARLHKMPLEQFEQHIKEILPFGVAYNKTMLVGVADVVDTANGQVIVYLSTEDLPDKLVDRMKYLLEHRRLWSMEQLRPYFADLFKDKVAFERFLVQKCEYTLGEKNEFFYCGVRGE
ncbi:unnamed protein product [Caenorhabditis auriculariae]|uniref:Sister chromatid cohesion protein DCC1 n=1 Tax=Caenorhabditis auriculariae TaxID=2777116 RepID=A0A8S1GRL9_9PELO|nr:unnamed protein product [Caenorhabditis auriculariae]